MHFLVKENPKIILPLVVVTVASLAFLFVVVSTETTRSRVSEAFGPAEGLLAKNGEFLIASWNATEEAVYATAVGVGIIPFEESSYYVVELPFHHARPVAQVAGAYIGQEAEINNPLPEGLAETEPFHLPWRALYNVFRGR